MGEHIPAITEHRGTNGYLEGFDRYEQRWVPLLPPRPGAPPAVLARWARVRDAMLAELREGRAGTRPVESSDRRGESGVRRRSPDYQAGYRAGYRAGLARGRREGAATHDASPTL